MTDREKLLELMPGFAWEDHSIEGTFYAFYPGGSQSAYASNFAYDKREGWLIAVFYPGRRDRVWRGDGRSLEDAVSRLRENLRSDAVLITHLLKSAGGEP